MKSNDVRVRVHIKMEVMFFFLVSSVDDVFQFHICLNLASASLVELVRLHYA